MKRLLILVLFMCVLSSKGQNIFLEIQQADSTEGKITIIQDEQVAQLLLARIDEIRNVPEIDGFRINLYEDGSHYKYEEYSSKLYVGNFRTRSEAWQVFNKIKNSYPKACVVRGKINLPDLE